MVGLDVNVEKNYKTKQDNYLPLCVELKKLYPDFSYEVIPIAIGATGLVMKKLSADLVPCNEVDRSRTEGSTVR